MQLHTLYETSQVPARTMLFQLFRALQKREESEFIDVNFDEDEKLTITDRADIAEEKTMFFQGPSVVTVSISNNEYIVASKNWPYYKCSEIPTAIVKILQRFITTHVNYTWLTADGLILNCKNQYFMYDRDQTAAKLKVGDVFLYRFDKNSSAESVLKIVEVLPSQTEIFKKFTFCIQFVGDDKTFTTSFNGTVKLLKLVKI